jgi:hypothetical protein
MTPFISLPENPRLFNLGMNGTRSEAEANHLFGPKLQASARRVTSLIYVVSYETVNNYESFNDKDSLQIWPVLPGLLRIRWAPPGRDGESCPHRAGGGHPQEFPAVKAH